jgi:RNA polymerase sigma-70 factor (ECF subfamily)
MRTQLKQKTDIILFEEIKEGNSKSFADLFSLYYSPLCNFAYLFVRDKSLAEEAVSDVFVNIWRKKENISIEYNLKSYLYKSTKNTIISYSRKRKLNVIRMDEYTDLSNFETPETLLLKSEKSDYINKIIESLPKKAGLVFRMHKVDGMKYNEISEVLGISEKTVENHMGFSLKHLRSLAQEHPQLIHLLITATLIGVLIGFNILY